MSNYRALGKDRDHNRRTFGGRTVRRDDSEKEAISSSRGVQIGGDFSEASSRRHASLLTDKGLMQPMHSTTRAEISRLIQQGYGNRHVQRLFKQAERPKRDTNSHGIVQRDWFGTENSSLSAASAGNMRVLKELVAEIARIPGSAGTIVPRKGSTDRRIDMRGPVPRGDDDWANIQCQVGGDSIAGVICPFDLDLEEVKRGLIQALEAGDILEWEAEEAGEVDNEFTKWVESETAEVPPIVLPRGMKSPPYH